MEVLVELQRGERLIEGKMASLKTNVCMGRLGGKKERKCVTLNSKKIHNLRQN